MKRLGLRLSVLTVVVMVVASGLARQLAAQSDQDTVADYALRVHSGEVVLFPFDTYAVPFRSGLQLDLVSGNTGRNPPVLPLGERGQPDSVGAAFYGTIIPIGNQLRMWYLCAGDKEKGVGFSWLPGVRWKVCYALSADGVHWEKPKLDLVEYGGSKANNLVALNPTSSDVWACLVIYDPDDPNPDRRFKMVYENHGPSGDELNVSDSVAYSRDGLTWTNSPGNPVFQRFEPSGITKRGGFYYVTGHGDGFGKRLLLVHASSDFEHWTQAVSLGLRRDGVGPLHPRMAGGSTDEQLHLGASLWDRGSVILGFYGQWHGPSVESEDRRDMRMDIGFVVSHDALHYSEPIPGFKMVRAADAKFPTESFRARLVQGQAFVNLGDQTLFWYSYWGPGGGDGVRLATWHRDRLGYYSVPAAVTEGARPQKNIVPHFISCPLRLDKPETKVYLNADGLSEHSQITVELLDEKFQPVPGYSGADSVPLAKSGLREPVKWRGKDAVGNFTGPVRIRVSFGGLQMEQAQVYAVYLE